MMPISNIWRLSPISTTNQAIIETCHEFLDTLKFYSSVLPSSTPSSTAMLLLSPLVTVIGCAGVVCPPLFALVLICGTCLCSSCLGCPFLLCSLSKDGQCLSACPFLVLLCFGFPWPTAPLQVGWQEKVEHLGILHIPRWLVCDRCSHFTWTHNCSSQGEY